MDCVKCGGDTKVADTRRVDHVTYRIRKCLECGHKFYTKEVETDRAGIDEYYAAHRQELRERRRKSDERKTKTV
nr:MAG TPA: Transcription factor S-II (TFIIS) [Bacteriophage sp.]